MSPSHPTAEQADEDLPGGEDPIIAALGSRGDQRMDMTPVARINVPTIQVPVVQNGRVVRDPETHEIVYEPWHFHVRALSRRVRQDIELASQERVDDPDNPTRKIDRLNQDLFERRMIYHATVPDERKRYWDNPALWAKWGSVDAFSLISNMLSDGQQGRAFLVIFDLGNQITEERLRLKDISGRAGN